MENACQDIIAGEHYVVRDGEVLVDDNGKPVPDPQPAEEARELLRRIQAARARFTGSATSE